MEDEKDYQIEFDWFKNRLLPPAQASFSLTDENLLFQASHRSPATVLPNSREGHFYPELWRYDVAEIFLGQKSEAGYFEVNLAPNGAWWMCYFEKTRQPKAHQPSFNGISAHGQCQKDHWKAQISIPKTILPPLEKITFNISLILNSPNQTFHTLAPLPGHEPDFHQPDSFLSLSDSLPT